MAKYRAVYKCPLCGREQAYGNAEEVPSNALPELLGKFQRLQKFANNPHLGIPPSHVPCKCLDGSAGLAPFAGFRIIN